MVKMPRNFSLSDRHQQVLRATVCHYIATAEPVGSEVLVKEYNLSVSSATIRNAMGSLERAGLLYQPHPSAGRIPSDSGYRIYVDHLMHPLANTPHPVTQVLSENLQWGSCSLEAILKGAAQILVNLSGYITLITMPLTRTLELRHVQLVQVDSQQVMLIIVTDTYESQSVLFDLPTCEDEVDADLLERELQVLSNFLNSQLRGKTLSEVDHLDWFELGKAFDHYGHWLQVVLQDLARRTSQTLTSTQLLISGIAEVLHQPEFTALNQLQNLLYLLEGQQHQLLSLIFQQPETATMGRRVSVRIGSENPLEPMQACTLISSTYHRGKVPVGSVGVLGPTRMNYETAISLVEATADYLSDRIP
jgi:heat-inducible transcriptional repressor